MYYIVFEKPFILFLQNILQWKKKYHTVPKYNRYIVKTETKSIPLIHIYITDYLMVNKIYVSVSIGKTIINVYIISSKVSLDIDCLTAFLIVIMKSPTRKLDASFFATFFLLNLLNFLLIIFSMSLSDLIQEEYVLAQFKFR